MASLTQTNGSTRPSRATARSTWRPSDRSAHGPTARRQPFVGAQHVDARVDLLERRSIGGGAPPVAPGVEDIDGGRHEEHLETGVASDELVDQDPDAPTDRAPRLERAHDE